MVKRSAFTLIELIFAIVIIGLVVVAVPRMLETNAVAMERSLMKEAVFLASVEANRLLAFQWDLNSIDTATELSYAKIVDTNFSTASTRVCFNPQTLVINDTMAAPCIPPFLLAVFPVGGISQDNHHRFHTASTLADSGLIGGQANAVTNLPLTSKDGYKRDYNISVASGFVSRPFGTEYNLTGSTDIKMIEISVSDNTAGSLNQGDTALLRAYAYNIGEIAYAKRTMP